MPSLVELKRQLEGGEKYLEKHPNDPNGLKWYWRYWAEYMRMATSEELHASYRSVTLALPDGVRWQSKDSEREHSEITVLFQGEPQADDELSYSAFRELVETMRLVKEGASP